MSSPKIPYDQRLARLLIRPFANTNLHPNHVTLFSLLLGIACGALFVFGEPGIENVAVAVFMLAVLVDHMD
ncbi:MAG: CDP-alcohol phosphatidyltransferase family protein, partial [Pseudomonadota bacterium]|nr:CDP-alcohol phosphatidyltransferase family protein [Pseudomonadota bacterium]